LHLIEISKSWKGVLVLHRNICASLALILALVEAPAIAQQQEHEQHHPAGTPLAAPVPGAGMPDGSMSEAGDMPMMGMMRMMMGQHGIGNMQIMAGHVEGRLAFLRTELKITDSQLAALERGRRRDPRQCQK
jgi:hypothetical protein